MLLNACAILMTSVEESNKTKQFPDPGKQKSGLYIYRNSFIGYALKKDLYIDGKFIGESTLMFSFTRKLCSQPQNLN